jgi:hypothetical protein
MLRLEVMTDHSKDLEAIMKTDKSHIAKMEAAGFECPTPHLFMKISNEAVA